MALVNEHFLKLHGSYLFSDIAKKINTFRITHPKKEVIRLGIGDVTRPLPPACIEAMHRAVDEMTNASTCDSTVATAAPYTPACSTNIKNKSPAMFNPTDTASMISGVTVSPSARSAAAHAS